MTKNIKAIIFDWGGVCCSEGEPFASLALQEKIGKNPNDIAKEVMDLYLDFYRGNYTDEEFWRLVMKHFGLEETDEINPEVLSKAYLDSYTLWPDVLDIAKQLQSKYTVGLLSDLSFVMRDHIKYAHNTAEFFPTEVYSCDEGVKIIKTDGTKIFNFITNKMVVSPQECLFIDNSKSKIKIAEEAGLNTIFFDNKEQFFQDIKEYL